MIRLIRIGLLFFLFLLLLGGCETKGSSYSDNRTEDTAIVKSPLSIAPVFEAEDTVEEETEDRGNLIIEHERIKVYVDYCLLEEDFKYGDDISAKDETYLIRCIDDTLSESTVLKGPYNRVLGKGKLCQIVVGTDTVNIDITKPFPKYVDLRFVGVLPECRFYRLSKHFTLSERSWPTDFQINLAIPDDAPEYIRNFINELIQDDVAGYFGDYSGDDVKYTDIPLYNLKAGDFNGLMRYYYRLFCRLYTIENRYEPDENEEIDKEDLIPRGPHYSYQSYIYPIWQNSDSSLTTWKFYKYGYTGGAHGGELEYYLTFDNKTGRMLGLNDFYSKSEFKKAIDVLTRQLNAYHHREPYSDHSYQADLNVKSNVTSEGSTLLNEFVDEKLYPRPALTKQGIVFTYQTYEKGANMDGVLHFVQPYKKDFRLK